MITLSSRNAKIKLLLVVVFLLLMPVAAIGSEPQKTCETADTNNQKAESRDGGNVFKRLSKGFSLHKDNYLLPGTWGNRAKGTEDVELKFQFSFKQQIWNGFYFAYTQKSFWRVLDGNDSRPFRETNYNPEIFYRGFTKGTGLRWGGDIGAEHESNGAREPTSRSWNRVYVAPTLLYKGLEAKLKLWYRLEEEVKKDPYDTNGDENPDIEDFYGYGELHLSYSFTAAKFTNPWQVALMARQNFATEKGGLQLDFSIPTKIKDFYVFGQLWTGYGESLIDYNHSFTRYGIGFSFRQ
ncbi:MAG: phospholipase A [Thermodesulfobacteriota bacterium]